MCAINLLRGDSLSRITCLQIWYLTLMLFLPNLSTNYPTLITGRAVHVTDIEIRMLLEPSVSAGRVIVHAQLFNGLVYGTLRVSGAVRTFANNIGKKLRD